MKTLQKAMQVGASRFCQELDRPWSGPARQPSTTGIRNWLLEGYGYSTVQNLPSGLISIECVDDSWAKANASDLIANREAGLESIKPRRDLQDPSRSLAWPVINAYYAAYFLMQSFLRCFGIGSVYLESNEANRLEAVWKTRGFSGAFTAGNFLFSIDLSSPEVVTLRRIGGGGGAHKQFWLGVEHSEVLIRTAILSSPALSILSSIERQAAVAEFEKVLKDFFQNASTPLAKPEFGWLSAFRNGINYRFEKNVWSMNWQHATGIIATHEAVVARYSSGTRVLPERERTHSQRHLAFVAARLSQLVDGATEELSVP